MATPQAIASAFELFKAVGLPRPKVFAEHDGVVKTLSAWALVFKGVDDATFSEGVNAWLATPDIRFWPSALQVRDAIPRRRPTAQLEVDDEVDRSPYGLAADWARRVALDAYADDTTLDFEEVINRVAAEVYPLHDPAFAALDEDARWLHWCARRNAAKETR